MIPFVGPSYALANRKASAQRSVNLFLATMETPGKASFIMERVPGLTQRVSTGAEIRGALEVAGRLFVVSGATLYEISAGWVATSRGTLNSISGPVSMAFGLNQLVIVDGADGYALTLADNTFTTVSDPDWPGADTVDFLDNYFILTKDRDGQAYYITAINDLTTIDALDFASSESLPDELVSHMVLGTEVLLFGTRSVEVHFNSGAADFPFTRNRGASIDVGLMSRASLKKCDGAAFFLGQDADGTGMVYALRGYQRQRISTQAVEEALADSTDLTSASAYTYQQHGRTFYCLNAPGVAATWCYEVSTGTWHERCDLDAFGEFAQGRIQHHAFCFGKHLGGDADGYVWEMSQSVYKNGTDAMVCERTSPHEAMPTLDWESFSEFVLDTTTGEGGVTATNVELEWSNDGGRTWSDPVVQSIGATGEYFPRLIWRRLGQARDRVWRVRFSGDAPFAIINGVAR